MARKRMIDPNFWQSEDVSKLSVFERLLLIGMISNSDDYGRGRANPNYLKSAIFPYDNILTDEIECGLRNIKRHISLNTYNIDGGFYYEFIKWIRWQKVDKPQKSSIPANINSSNGSTNDSSNDSINNYERFATNRIEKNRIEKNRIDEEEDYNNYNLIARAREDKKTGDKQEVLFKKFNDEFYQNLKNDLLDVEKITYAGKILCEVLSLNELNNLKVDDFKALSKKWHFCKSAENPKLYLRQCYDDLMQKVVIA